MEERTQGVEKEPRFTLTSTGRAFQREERYMKTLAKEERKLYEECLALLQEITDSGDLEEACELLEKQISAKNEKETQ